MVKEVPVGRPLNNREKAVLERVLSGMGDPLFALKSQIGDTSVLGAWGPASPSVDLQASGAQAVLGLDDGVLPDPGTVVDPSGEPLGEVLIWVKGGLLAGIEYAWFTEEVPERLPSAEGIVIMH